MREEDGVQEPRALPPYAPPRGWPALGTVHGRLKFVTGGPLQEVINPLLLLLTGWRRRQRQGLTGRQAASCYMPGPWYYGSW